MKDDRQFAVKCTGDSIVVTKGRGRSYAQVRHGNPVMNWTNWYCGLLTVSILSDSPLPFHVLCRRRVREFDTFPKSRVGGRPKIGELFWYEVVDQFFCLIQKEFGGVGDH